MITLLFAELTIRETQRRKILWVGLLLGLAYLAVFGIGFHYIFVEMEQHAGLEERLTITGVLLTAGLYVANLLVVLMSVLVSVTAVSGEIDSHTIEAIVTKPIRRWELILGKWLGFAILITLYILLMAGGLMLIIYLRADYVLDNIAAGLSLMMLEALLILSVTFLGGTRLSTLANGVLAFMLFGIAFLGGMIEQIGALFENGTAVNIGIITSLIMPTQVLWNRALMLFQPQFANSAFLAGPFAVLSQPSNLMLAYAAGFTIVMLLLALFSFSRRDL
ncbi:MAG: ABC transporter permease subunit [Chloroflexi bacterium]|nr:ABC transporter permease subunit [Chloroflexota bacterium]